MSIGFAHTWWYHFNSVGNKLYYVLPFKSIQMVLEGPLIHHLEVSKQGFVLAVLPFGKIQTRFCISWPTIQSKPLGNQHCTYSYFTIQNHNTEWFQIGGLIKFLRWVNSWFDFDLTPIYVLKFVGQGEAIYSAVNINSTCKQYKCIYMRCLHRKSN